MIHKKLSRAVGRAVGGGMPSWVRLARIARLGLGGVIIGSFLGVYLGAVLGLGYAAWAGNLSAALEGALIGGAVIAVIGGVYGSVLGMPERDDAPVVNARWAVTRHPEFATPDPARPAGRRGTPHTPEMEHLHDR